MIHPERIRFLNDRPARRGDWVLYWMQASQREEYNHALEHAVRRSRALGLPVVVCFGLTDRYPEANERHYRFMLEGLRETERALAERGIRFALVRGEPHEAAIGLARRAAEAVVDRGYLRHQRRWRDLAAAAMDCPLVEVETDAIVPVETVMEKEAYTAAVLRRRIAPLLDRFLSPLRRGRPGGDSLGMDLPPSGLDDLDALLDSMSIDREVPPVPAWRGGTSRARRRLDRFLSGGLDRFADERNDPSAGAVSGLSPYLHFGQISPLRVALMARAAGGTGVDAFLEELIVRRELSFNFVRFNPEYDRFGCLPDWCRRTLEAHGGDPRPYEYGYDELEMAATHDSAWNAAQREMTRTGKMHGYMRMYWGKKILEWTADPAEAMETALRLNNRWELDGRDPNGYAGVAWCFGKHDRPWAERQVFGTVRYMNAAGLRRKFDVDRYIESTR